ncbi:MAG TPA: hypothetical protein VN702_17610 [Acetobacteraceae bacterium]|nr:hypothetical protein [Acetobacteraceae bacterium]
MVILAGLMLGAAVLYVWLLGHWFGRVLMFLACGAFLTFIVVAIGGRNSDAAPLLLFLAVALAISWAIASIPMWVRQRSIPDIAFNDDRPGRDLV